MPTLELVGALNSIAGTTGLGPVGAANVLAGNPSPPRALVGALNLAAGTTGLGLNAVCNVIAGTVGLSAVGALNNASGGAGVSDPILNLVEPLV